MRKISYALSLLFIFTIPWETVVEDPALGTASRVIGFAVTLSWFATVLLTRQLRKPTLFHVAVYLFVLWNALSIIWSTNADRSIARLMTWLQLLALLYILWDLYTTRVALLGGLQAYVLGCYVACGNMIFNYFAGNTFYFERFSATDTNPDDLGAVLALGIPVAWYLVVPKYRDSLPRLLRWVNYSYTAAALMGITLTATRTSLIAAVPGIMFGLATLMRLRLPGRIAVFVFLVAIACVLFPLMPQASVERLGTTGSEMTAGDLNGRIRLWREGFASFAQHPLLGVGSDMFRSVNDEGKVAHNSFISVLVELGIVGFILFALVLTIVFVQVLRLPVRDLSFWLTVLAVWAIVASTLTWEQRKPTWLFLSFMIACAALARDGDETVRPIRDSQPQVAGSTRFATRGV